MTRERIDAWLGPESETLVRYGLQDVTVGKYGSADGASFATVEIFHFPDFVRAFGAYSLRKDAARQILQIVNEAYATRHSIHLWRGTCYVRVTGGPPAAFVPMSRLAAFVAERIPPAPSLPTELDILPAGSRVHGSERYSIDSGLGQPFLGNSFQARFEAAGGPIEGLVVPTANEPAATHAFEAFKTLYVRNGRLLGPVPGLGADSFTAEDRYLGRAVAFRTGRYVVAFNSFGELQKLVDLATETLPRARAAEDARRIAERNALRQEAEAPAVEAPPVVEPEQATVDAHGPDASPGPQRP